MKLADFQSAIKAHKGKVVVIDFWSTLCISCMRDFHHLVELHHKYHDKGVVCMSVNVGLLEAKADSQKFLDKKKAVFANFLLDDEKKEWQDPPWDIVAIPAVMVYDAAGTLYPFRNSPEKQFTYADVEKLVQKLIAK